MWRVRQWEESQLLPFSETAALPKEQVPREGGNVVSVVDAELEKSMNIQVRKSHRQTRGQGWRRGQSGEISSLCAIIEAVAGFVGRLWFASPSKGDRLFFLCIPIASNCLVSGKGSVNISILHPLVVTNTLMCEKAWSMYVGAA